MATRMLSSKQIIDKDSSLPFTVSAGRSKSGALPVMVEKDFSPPSMVLA